MDCQVVFMRQFVVICALSSLSLIGDILCWRLFALLALNDFWISLYVIPQTPLLWVDCAISGLMGVWPCWRSCEASCCQVCAAGVPRAFPIVVRAAPSLSAWEMLGHCPCPMMFRANPSANHALVTLQNQAYHLHFQFEV